MPDSLSLSIAKSSSFKIESNCIATGVAGACRGADWTYEVGGSGLYLNVTVCPTPHFPESSLRFLRINAAADQQDCQACKNPPLVLGKRIGRPNRDTDASARPVARLAADPASAHSGLAHPGALGFDGICPSPDTVNPIA